MSYYSIKKHARATSGNHHQVKHSPEDEKAMPSGAVPYTSLHFNTITQLVNIGNVNAIHTYSLALSCKSKLFSLRRFTSYSVLHTDTRFSKSEGRISYTPPSHTTKILKAIIFLLIRIYMTTIYSMTIRANKIVSSSETN